MYRSREAGAANPLLISTILFAFLTVVFASVMVWALVNYMDQKNNVDSKVADAVEIAKAEQAEADEAAFIEREKEPYRVYAGSADLGSVRFNYPKTWSVYEASNSADSGLNTYLHPKVVPPIDADGQVFAARVEVRGASYESVLSEYEGTLEDGSLKARPYAIGEYRGMRMSGKLDESHTGVAVLFKVRDKTLIITTNSPAFVKDLDNVILKSLQFNP